MLLHPLKAIDLLDIILPEEYRVNNPLSSLVTCLSYTRSLFTVNKLSTMCYRNRSSQFVTSD